MAPRNVADGDAVLVMGGGKSYRIAELLLEALEAAGQDIGCRASANRHTGGSQHRSSGVGDCRAGQEARQGMVARSRSTSSASSTPRSFATRWTRFGARRSNGRLPRRDRRPPAGQGRAGAGHRRRVPGDRGARSHRVEGGPARAVPEGLRLGHCRACRGNKVRQRIGLRSGLPEDLAKRIQKLIRDEFPKIKSQIQGDAVRVSGKSRTISSGSSPDSGASTRSSSCSSRTTARCRRWGRRCSRVLVAIVVVMLILSLVITSIPGPVVP